MIEFFNIQKLLKIYKDFPVEGILQFLDKEMNLKGHINVVFTDPRKIKRLNKQYREKNEVTDLLSFNIDSDNLFGEIYICPKYIMKTIGDIEYSEQILRILIHGILHLQGYDHKKKFDKVDYKDEPMYIKQEDILNKFLTR